MLLKIKTTSFHLAALTAMTFSSAAWAHHPVASCKQVAQQMIECEGGFSDGSKAAGVAMEILSYDEKILLSSKLDNDSRLRFKRPDVDFYVLFDAGPGHVVEIDQSDIEEAS